MRSVVIAFLLSIQLCFGVQKAPSVVRICLDNNTGIATVYWQNLRDTCNSFSKNLLYASENNGPWILQKTITNISTISTSVVVTDINSSWKYKIVTYFACNGIDSLESNELSIDQSKPSIMEIDSVSFDPITQKILLGWKNNPAQDTKGYRVYQYNNSVNNKIADVDSNHVILLGFNKSNPADFTIAAYDSCNLFSAISNFQRAAYLNGSIDTCKRSVSLGWSLYQGWNASKQFLVTNINGNGYHKTQTFIAGENSTTINNIKTGDSICYYIRTEEISSGKTASSNTLCFKLKSVKVPIINYLSNVTVESNSYIKFAFETDKNADTDSIIVERKSNAEPAFKIYNALNFKSVNSHTEINDMTADFNNFIYAYRIKTIDKCHNLSSTSNTGKSILLSKPVFNNDQYNFNWNPFTDWEKGVSGQDIEMSPNSFTWNTYQNAPSTLKNIYIPKSVIDSDSVCFRIKNIENINSLNTSAESYSNQRCLYVIRDFYFPETLNPFSNNNVFKIYGNGYDKNRALIEIFNRWGEKIFMTTDLETGWDTKVNGEPVDMGNYIYKVSFYDQLNKYYLKTGSILVIR